MLAIIQLDSPDLTRLERLLEQGRLPALAALRERGSWLQLRTPATHYATGTYATLYSGTSPGDHGLYYPFQWKADEQRVRLVDDFPYPETVWERAGRAGRRVLLVDPYEVPSTPVNGLGLCGWQFTNRVVLSPWSSPARARRKLVRRFGRPPAVDEVFGRPSVSRLLRMRGPLLAAADRVAAVVRHALERDSFDLVWVAFPCAHVAGHQFWDLTPLGDDRLSSGDRQALESTLDDVYIACDRAIGELVEALPEDADLVTLSPLGMKRNSALPDLMPALVAAVAGDEPGEAPSGAGARAWWLRSMIPTGIRASGARLLPARIALELTTRTETPKLDWSRTRAFAVPSDVQGYVRLNLRGRERLGIVEPAQADALLEKISAGLLSFRDEEGRQAIESVRRTSELEGDRERVNQLPDLVVGWNDRLPNGPLRLVSPTFGTVERRGWGSGRSGNHDDRAWAILVPGNSREREPDRPPEVVDIAATACALLGADTSGLAGEPLLTPV